MPSLGVQIMATFVVLLLSVWGSLSFVYPELVFRIENIFMLRSVELSSFGLVVHKLGGIFLITVAVAIPVRTGVPVLFLAAMIGTALPPLYFFRTRGTAIVQTI